MANEQSDPHSGAEKRTAVCQVGSVCLLPAGGPGSSLLPTAILESGDAERQGGPDRWLKMNEPTFAGSAQVKNCCPIINGGFSILIISIFRIRFNANIAVRTICGSR